MNAQFEYFVDSQAEMFSFYRIPKLLFTDDKFKKLSSDAKILYGLMLDRMALSMKNKWLDAENRVYIIFQIEEIMELMNCSKPKAVKTMAELDSDNGIGLIQKKRLGMGKPNIIYVKNFMSAVHKDPEDGKTGTINASEPECKNTAKRKKNMDKNIRLTEEKKPPVVSLKADEKPDILMQKPSELQEVKNFNFKKSTILTSRSKKNELQEVKDFNCNNTNINNTDINNQSIYPSISLTGMDVDGKEGYQDIIKQNIDYDALCCDYEKDEIDEVVKLLSDVVSRRRGFNINGDFVPIKNLRERYLELNGSHVRYVLLSVKNNTTKIKNIRSYLLTAFYNAPVTMKQYYQAKVNYDLYGQKEEYYERE